MFGTDRTTFDRRGVPGSGPYHGDTACFASLPLLCIFPGEVANPGVRSSTYAEWSGGILATTAPVRGTALRSYRAASEVCAHAFGPGWRMAEFHDGWGWGFLALGAVRSDTRFWVAIDDQPANCWD